MRLGRANRRVAAQSVGVVVLRWCPPALAVAVTPGLDDKLHRRDLVVEPDVVIGSETGDVRIPQQSVLVEQWPHHMKRATKLFMLFFA